MTAANGWGADPNLLPGRAEKGPHGSLRYVPAQTMSRGDAIRTIMGAVELVDEAAVEEALMTLGVNPAELFFQSAPLSV